ncbi:MAG: PspC domain-containing protein [Lachnospiraceae bacterium]|jgi:phage shock protein C|nr:PspC domain-containing protein [Lachnospiraceae bacterium]
MNNKRLYKSKQDNKICGVCGGIAEYFGMDSTIVRLLWCLFTLAGGSGIIAYILAALIMPEEYED